MQEIWKDMVGYEEFYQVGNLGNVKSLARTCGTSRKRYTCAERVLKQNTARGYYTVSLYKGSKCKQFRVNRLVAQAFIPNSDNLPIINHKDENKQNNCVDNLEVKQQEN